MPSKPGIVYQANRDDGREESLFYHELMKTLRTVNINRIAAGEAPVGYRKVVIEGLGLPDSFTGKIKNGKYVPTRDKLEACAAYLGIRPETWDTYVRRYAVDQLDTPEVIDLFRILASLPEPANIIALRGAVNWLQRGVDEARRKKPITGIVETAVA